DRHAPSRGTCGGGFGGLPLRQVSFFFQAEDGIRDKLVTGVQTCALPIWSCTPSTACTTASVRPPSPGRCCSAATRACRCRCCPRSEERRVGKECRQQCCR